MRFAKFRSEEGSVVLEFVGFGLLLQVPLLAAALALTSLQHDQLAAEAINRDALRSLMLVDRPPSETAAALADDFGIPLSRVNIHLECESDDCESPGSLLRMSTRIGSAYSQAVGVR